MSIEKYAMDLKNIDFKKYYFGTNLFYDKQLIESFPIRFPEGKLNYNIQSLFYIMTCKTPSKKYILCCCQLGGNIRGNEHTIWNLFKTLEASNLKGVCKLFITFLSLYYNKIFKSDKLLNLFIIKKYSIAAYKSYIKCGFYIDDKKSFWLNYRGNEEYAIHMIKN